MRGAIDLHVQGLAKNLAKFSDRCSVKADGLCIGSPRLVGGRKVENSNKQDFFAPAVLIIPKSKPILLLHLQCRRT